MPLADEDVVALLGRLPPLQEAPEAARDEALVVVKRGQNFEAEPDADRAALKCYRDALELDPACKAGYEAVAKLLLRQRSLAKPAVEAGVRYLEHATKKFPDDAGISDLAKKMRALLSPAAAIEPALAKSTGKFPPSKKVQSGRTPSPPGRQQKCPYCGSPIPIGSENCKSCQLSGEIAMPDLKGMKRTQEKQQFSKRFLVILLLAVLAIGGFLGFKIVGRLR